LKVEEAVSSYNIPAFFYNELSICLETLTSPEFGFSGHTTPLFLLVLWVHFQFNSYDIIIILPQNFRKSF
jgi:hypothetical protein